MDSVSAPVTKQKKAINKRPVHAITITKLDSKQRFLYLILFEICPDSPAFIIGQCVSVFLEKGVDTGDSSVPWVFQVF